MSFHHLTSYAIAGICDHHEHMDFITDRVLTDLAEIKDHWDMHVRDNIEQWETHSDEPTDHLRQQAFEDMAAFVRVVKIINPIRLDLERDNPRIQALIDDNNKRAAEHKAISAQ